MQVKDSGPEHGLSWLPRLEARMPYRQEIEYLRTRARRMREIARIQTAISPELVQMADDLDARADELEQAGGFIKVPPPD